MPNLNEYFCRIYENMQGRYEQKKKIKVRLWPQFEMFACTILGFKMAKLLSTSHNYHFTLRHSWHLVCIDNTGINMEKKSSYVLLQHLIYLKPCDAFSEIIAIPFLALNSFF